MEKLLLYICIFKYSFMGNIERNHFSAAFYSQHREQVIKLSSNYCESELAKAWGIHRLIET